MKNLSYLILIITLLLLPSCGGNNVHTDLNAHPITLRHARNFKMCELPDGVTIVTLINPWDTLNTLAKYALIDKNAEIPLNLPEDVVIIRTPVDKSVVYSGVHVSLIDELGKGDAVSGVCDTEYIQDQKTLNAVRNGRIIDCGNYLTPNVERIISLQPEIVMLSPFENNDITAPLSKTGINLVLAADYMESTPLGRAEWMRFYGRLYGESDKADSLFTSIEKDYENLRNKTVSLKQRPAVLFDRLYSGVWDVPTSESVTGILIEDAGGSNPFMEYKNGGSAHLSSEEVLIKAHDAEIWLIRYIEPVLTLESISKENVVYSKFRAYKTGNVYGANTLKTSLFEDGAFHPNKTLREMVRILHPELESTPLNYYSRMK